MYLPWGTKGSTLGKIVMRHLGELSRHKVRILGVEGAVLTIYTPVGNTHRELSCRTQSDEIIKCSSHSSLIPHHLFLEVLKNYLALDHMSSNRCDAFLYCVKPQNILVELPLSA